MKNLNVMLALVVAAMVGCSAYASEKVRTFPEPKSPRTTAIEQFKTHLYHNTFEPKHVAQLLEITAKIENRIDGVVAREKDKIAESEYILAKLEAARKKAKGVEEGEE